MARPEHFDSHGRKRSQVLNTEQSLTRRHAAMVPAYLGRAGRTWCVPTRLGSCSEYDLAAGQHCVDQVWDLLAVRASGREEKVSYLGVVWFQGFF